jgi:hypothetical protein
MYIFEYILNIILNEKYRYIDLIHLQYFEYNFEYKFEYKITIR